MEGKTILNHILLTYKTDELNAICRDKDRYRCIKCNVVNIK